MEHPSSPARASRRQSQPGAGTAADRETLVLLHSLGTDRRLWRHQEAVLGSRYRVLAPDAPGHGGRPWPGHVSHDSWVSDLDDQLAEAGPVHLVGLSMGAHVAACYAAARPERVRSVVLANAFARLPEQAARDRVHAATEGVRSAGMADYASAYLAQTLTRGIGADDYAVLHDAIASMDPDAYLGSASLTFTGDLRHRLAQVSCPVLVLSGAADQKVPVERVTELIDALPGARHVVVAEAGHLSCIEQPDAFTKALTAFLQEHQVATDESERVVR